MELENRRIVVTGSSGFVGSHLVTALRRKNYEVIPFDLPIHDIRNPADMDVLEGADTVFHLATYQLNPCKANPNICIDTNILGTLNVIHACLKYNVRRLNFSSASSVYGNPVRMPAQEGDETKPLTVYGVTKLASEGLIYALVGSKDFAMTYTVFRFTNIYGPGQESGLIPNVINKLLDDEVIEVNGTGTQTRDFVYVDDVIDILIKSIDKPIYSITMNLGSGKQTSVNEVIKLASDYLGKTPKVHYNPYDLDRNEFSADITLLEAIHGKKGFTSFRAGLEETLKYETA
jgi:nucleoside-diphosphate-sugar epimerase